MNQLLENLSNPKYVGIITIGILVIFFIWSLPNQIHPVRGGLDPSWMVGIHLAKLHELVWGSEVIFTYGPLGYLIQPLPIDQSLWSHAFFYKISVNILFFLTIGLLSLKTRFPYLTALAFGIFSVFLVGHMHLPLIGILLGYYLYLEYSRKPILLIPLAFATAFMLFIKGEFAFGALSVMVLSGIILLTQKRVKEVMICTVAYVSFVIAIWLAMNYPLGAFWDYLVTLSSSISGYTVAVAKDKFSFLIWFALAGWALYFWWILDSARKNKKNLKILFISAGLLFIFFRLGFVREDHAYIFFISWSAILLIFLIINKKTMSNNLLKYSTIFILISFVFIGSYALPETIRKLHTPPEISEQISLSTQTLVKPYQKSLLWVYPIYLQHLIDDETFERQKIAQKEKLRDYYPLIPQNVLNIMGNQTVDVVPYDISLMYSYNLNWHPRPGLGSYLTYNAHLDNLDAKFFLQKNSPSFIVYKPTTIDNRYYLFDTPSTTRVILCNYHQIEELENGFSILEKNSENICFEENKISEVEVKFGERISVPTTEGYVFGKIYIKQNILGKLSNLLYKSPYVFIQLNDIENKFRFIYPTAENGLLLSSSIDLENNSSIMKHNIKSIVITTDFENYFEEKIRIEFVEQKAKTPKI